MLKIAWFISAHGFGHAARSSAVIEAMSRQRPDVGVELFTTVPAWFFSASLSVPVNVHYYRCDVGLVQRTSLHEDPSATLERLDGNEVFGENAVTDVTRLVEALGCAAVVADISPLGLLAAERAGLPSILIENFTWDWIYGAYARDWPGFNRWIDLFAEIVARCGTRIQAAPCCHRVPEAVFVPPVSRAPRRDRRSARRSLGIGDDEPTVLVSMGGVEWEFSALDRIAGADGVKIVVPGGSTEEYRDGSLIALPHHSRYYHPDLVHAADAVVAKLGYSTLAEVWSAGCPLGWIGRPTFRESRELAAWVGQNLAGVEISADELASAAWVDRIPDLLGMDGHRGDRANGAEDAARAVLEACG